LQKGAAGDIKFLVQGTLYPDVIESVSVKGPSATIKTHHNVGGLPENMPFALVEPLRDLFKDEVRRIGKDLGLPEEILVEASVSGAGAGGAVAWRDYEEGSGDAARSRCDCGRGDSAGRIVRESLAGVCGAATSEKRGRHGRWKDLRIDGGCAGWCSRKTR